jgi:hypothetical protein
MQPSETATNTIKNIRELGTRLKELKRPSSSPSKIDPRTKVPVEELGRSNGSVFIVHWWWMSTRGRS